MKEEKAVKGEEEEEEDFFQIACFLFLFVWKDSFILGWWRIKKKAEICRTYGICKHDPFYMSFFCVLIIPSQHIFL